LCLSTRQRFCRTTKRQIVETNVDEEAKPFLDLLEDRTRDLRIEPRPPRLAQNETVEKGQRFGDRKLGQLTDISSSDRDGERLGLEPTAPARRARNLDHELLEL
jgi:hypothetical protein